MNTIEAVIKKGEWLLSALKRIGHSMIPTNVILDKTLPGLGATHSEIHSERNSIIIEPGVAAILCKAKENSDALAVYEKCSVSEVRTYMKGKIPYKKILTTPEGFSKVRNAAASLGINIYEKYFCLFDECEKITQDVDYRNRISQPINDFFRFKNKAFVSATPLEMTHPAFEEQGFQIIKIVPDYEYRKKLKLIVTNSYFTTLKEELATLKDSKCICIFFNRTDAINELINNLEIKDYKIFCSQKSVNKLNKRFIKNAYSEIDYPLAKYNFFTCRFYSALDIFSRKHKPDILILTDLRTAQFTMIDPFTEAIQIQGRFRKISDDDVTYNSLTHISTIDPDMEVLSKEEVRDRVEQFAANYSHFETESENATNDSKREAIFKDMQGLTYSKILLDEEGEINYFSVDNLYNEERVKSYYVSVESLHQAYLRADFFDVELHDRTECIGKDDFERLNYAKQGIDKRKMIVKFLERLDIAFKFERLTLEEKDSCIDILKDQEEAIYVIPAYNKIGRKGFEEACYKKGEIDKAVEKYDKEQAPILRISPEVLQKIKEEFKLDVYIPKQELQRKLYLIYMEHSIKYKVTQDTIKDYYDTNESNSRKNGASYKLKAFKFE